MTTFLLGACAMGLIFALYLAYTANQQAQAAQRALVKERRAKDRDSKVAKEMVTDTAAAVGDAMEKVTKGIGEAITSSLGFNQPYQQPDITQQDVFGEKSEDKRPVEYPPHERDEFFVDPAIPEGDGEWGPPSTDGVRVPDSDLGVGSRG